ncbi:response regulator [Roseimicrobium sp. ORNL1]|uniref:response regulator n=1 Tax=Roseimicrobium sp. ORNL1 TaxID=2711231 RepID=UPI0013E1DB3C|nr:response regulator [Roseimicrobium sp. ORNL1]QIF03238.1 response regulator [Roseimicrobium sp. ORNL1]
MTPTEPIKFLLVDDLEANLQALVALLRRDGLELLTARSGSEALELLLAHDISLAFLDVQMPVMDGFELAEVMRSTERTRQIPIIFLTAGIVDSQRRIRGYETGAVDFLAKPIEAHVLLNKAATFFDLACQRRELALTNAKLEQADRLKDEFLAMLAHELRNPLAPLRNAAEILQSDYAETEERGQALNILSRQIENMTRMIDDLLDVSRITEGKIELRKESVNLASVVQAASSLIRSECASRGQELAIKLPESPVYLHADSTRLEQVFGNLLMNASKYGGEGCHITVNAERAGPDVIISVTDDGTGIEPELLPRIFDLFVQASRTLDRRHGGLGIGLTLVQRIVRLHGGTIEARSKGLGQGSQFIVRLPAMTAPPAGASPARGKPAFQTATAPRRLLIVDDNTDSARSLAILQTRLGHETRTAYSGTEALEVAAEFKPEVVMLDIGLPGMDGFEVARKLRSMPDLSGVFLIAMTGYGSVDSREEGRKAGFDAFLVKPIDLRELQGLLGSLP